MGTIDLPKFTLDFDNRLFIAKAGVTAVDVQVDMYSDWKEGILANNSGGEAEAMLAEGGAVIDPLTDERTGTTYFLLNGYKIRPDEADHTLVVTGNLLPGIPGEPLVVPTVGNFTVNVISDQSALVFAKVARVDLVAVTNAIYIDTVNGSDTNDGTPLKPVATIGQAKTLADLDGVRTYRFRGNITVSTDHDRWTFIGEGAEFFNQVNLNNSSVDESNFINCQLSGDSANSTINAVSCELNGMGGVDGVFRECGFISTVKLDQTNGVYIFDRCHSRVPGTGRPIISLLNATGQSVQFRNYAGGISVRDMTSGNMSLDVNSGSVDLDSTVTGGTIVVRGHGLIVDRSVGAMVNLSEGFVDGDDLFITQQLISGNAEVSTDNRTITIYDRDGTTVLATYDISVDGRVRTRLT